MGLAEADRTGVREGHGAFLDMTYCVGSQSVKMGAAQSRHSAEKVTLQRRKQRTKARRASQQCDLGRVSSCWPCPNVMRIKDYNSEHRAWHGREVAKMILEGVGFLHLPCTRHRTRHFALNSFNTTTILQKEMYISETTIEDSIYTDVCLI